MKKKITTVATSIASIAVCASVIAGSTYALFTSESKTDITVKSGTVKVVATVNESSLQTKQLYDTEWTAGTNGLFGGTVTIGEYSLTASDFVAGDAVKFTLDVSNVGTVNAKYRTVLKSETDLGELKVTIGGSEAVYDGSAAYSAWENIDAGKTVKGIELTLALPEEAVNQNVEYKLTYLVEAVQGNADTSEPEDIGDWDSLEVTYENDVYSVVGLKEGVELSSLNIPATYGGKEVKIASEAFAKASFDKVVVNCPVIAENAFGGGELNSYEEYLAYEGIKELYIGANVKEIGANAFYPAQIWDVGDHVWISKSNLTKVEFDKDCKLETIGSSAFANAYELESIVLPETVTSIGSGAFSGCSALKEIAIPAGVTEIQSSTFYNCSSLTEVVIPEGVTSIGYGAFLNCDSLTTVVIPDSVEYIGEQVFQNCFNIESVTMPTAIMSKFKSLEYASLADYTAKYVDGKEQVAADVLAFAEAFDKDKLHQIMNEKGRPNGFYELKVTFFEQYTSLNDMLEKLGEKNFGYAIGFFYYNDSTEEIAGDLPYEVSEAEVENLFASIENMADYRYEGWLYYGENGSSGEALRNKIIERLSDDSESLYNRYLSVTNALGDMEFVKGMFSTHSNVGNKVNTITFNGNVADWDARITRTFLFSSYAPEGDITVVCKDGTITL